MRGYTEAKVTTTKDSLVMQLQAIMTRDYKGHRPFSKDVHITRCEFIFNPLLGASKKDQEAMKNDEYIVFKSTKPDLDNLEKMLWDACEEAGVTMIRSLLTRSLNMARRTLLGLLIRKPVLDTIILPK